ncbi:platelet endothelial aggregation receptor 1-like isoform X2 [Saccostrea cucullata]|uniref:platelet endothelial aggregation receptor 1-like isoform X2 n=1 Tax=Saccostrea cuccullata TaxID=36930 RepID=UPI002ED3132A
MPTFAVRECKIGYYGMNCSSPCPPPTFGLDCQTLCPCENDICNHITGCMLERGTTESLTQSTADLHVLRNQPASMNSLMTVGISSLAILSTVIFVVYIGLKIFPRNKKTVRHLDIELMDLSQSKNNPCKT